VLAGQLAQRGLIKRGAVDRRHLARGDRHHAGGPDAALQAGALAEHGARAVLGQHLAVVLDPGHPVEHKVYVRPVGVLPHQGGAGRVGGNPRLDRTLHQVHRQLPLKR